MLELSFNNGAYNAVCPDCGQVIKKWIDATYVAENPNACDEWLNQLWVEHISEDTSCPAYTEHEVVCEKCGEVLGTYSPAYAESNPNGLDMWIAQLEAEHELDCPESDLTPDDPILLLDVELNLNGCKKPFKFYQKFGLYSNYDHIVEYDYYDIEWSKGGVDSNSAEEILIAWEQAVNNIISHYFKDDGYVAWEFVLQCKYALKYELRAKNVLNGKKVTITESDGYYKFSLADTL